MRKTRKQPKQEIISLSHPPMLRQSNIIHSTRMRFRVLNTTESSSISFKNLLDTVLMATTATAGSCLFTYVKVRAVEMWFYPRNTPLLDDTVAVTFLGVTAGSDGNGQIVSDTSMGLEAAHVWAVPNVNSLCAKWQNSTDTGAAFNLRAPAGSVVDVELSFKNAYGAAVAVTNALAAATAGTIYLRGLDGLAGASTNFIPQLASGALFI